MPEPDRTLARRLARESLDRGDAVGWFDALYDVAQGDAAQIPWADMRPNPNLIQWLDTRPAGPDAAKAQRLVPARALVVGCGLGDDAEHLAQRGFRVTAFDVSAKAIDWCRRRFPQSTVDYCAADLLAPPESWRGAFDLVVEIYTLQVLPPELRPGAQRNLAAAVSPPGVLLVIARARDTADDRGTMPWPLTQEELTPADDWGLKIAAFEDFLDTSEDPPVRRFRIEYRRT